MNPTKDKKAPNPTKEILKGCGLTPIGNVCYSLALSLSNMSVVAPISSLYTVINKY